MVGSVSASYVTKTFAYKLGSFNDKVRKPKGVASSTLTISITFWLFSFSIIEKSSETAKIWLGRIEASVSFVSTVSKRQFCSRVPEFFVESSGWLGLPLKRMLQLSLVAQIFGQVSPWFLEH